MAQDEGPIDLVAMQKTLQQLAKQRQQRAARATDDQGPVPPDWLRDLESLDVDHVIAQARQQVGEWVGQFDEELGDVRPSTIALLLGAGFVLGRMSK
ncbi:hypothetical protein OAS86_05230 [Gammaproteobacteria bacterium]|nr:hypothetical protein [Gammaproteobacteria bacterium]